MFQESPQKLRYPLHMRISNVLGVEGTFIKDTVLLVEEWDLIGIVEIVISFIRSQKK